MRFGQTLFAGSLSAGFVTAAGLSLCAATALGQPEVQRYVSSTATAGAAAQATDLRFANGQGLTATAGASAVAQASGNYLHSGLAQAVASGLAAAHFDASAMGTALVNSSSTECGEKRSRLYPYHADAGAQAQANGETYVVAKGSPAQASATLYGTTYYLGYGHAVATASLFGLDSQQAGAHGLALGQASGTAQSLYVLGAQGKALVQVILFGDAAVTRSGVRYFEGLGRAEAQSQVVVNTLLVYQSQTGYAGAAIQGTPNYTLGAHGSGLATASASGDGIGASTAVTGVPGTTSAVASGQAQARLFGAGLVYAGASTPSTRDALVKHTHADPAVALSGAAGNRAQPLRNVIDAGMALAGAVLYADVVKTHMVSSSALAGATVIKGPVGVTARGSYMSCGAHATASALKNAKAVGNGLVGASLSVQTRQLSVSVKTMVATAQLNATGLKTLFGTGSAKVASQGQVGVQLNLSGLSLSASATATGDAHRDARTTGSAQASATVVGYNQINEFSRAPAERSYLLDASSRLLAIPAEDRLLTL